ncbi:MAG: alpha-methylacyl-CoA racemase [Halieaceae bacterium]|jgi:alpha-methylacyl-CoA racemase
MSGPLTGLKVVEFAGIGPGPFACMLLADLGADVIRVDRLTGGNALGAQENPADVLNRGRRSIAVNLKSSEGVEAALKLVDSADVLVEGFRPGVMEKLGLGPDVCAQRNPRLIYARMTGWGQSGPLSHAAGHDINYIAITGSLNAIGRKDSGPVPPLNLLGDFGGGSMYLLLGIMSALYERQNSGLGQVVDAAITDGVISLMAFTQGFAAMGMWNNERQSNMLDGAAPYYDTYQCSDGKWISVGSIEPQFFALLMEKLGIEQEGEANFATQFDQTKWPEMKSRVADIFSRKSRDDWCEIMEGTDVCFAPVLDMNEAPAHPHNVARDAFVERDGVVQTAPAPRFSRTPGEIGATPVGVGCHSRAILAEAGVSPEAIAALFENGAVG